MVREREREAMRTSLSSRGNTTGGIGGKDTVVGDVRAGDDDSGAAA